MFKFDSKRITLIAMMIALNTVVNVYEVNFTPTLKFGLTITVTSLAGLLTGFIGGAITGFLGDLLGCFIQGYAPIPLLSVSSTLMGLIPGLAFDLYKYYTRKKVNIAWGCVIIGLCQLILFGLVTMLINPYAFYLLNKKPGSFVAYAISIVFPFKLITSIGNLVTSISLFISITRIPFFDKYLDGYKTKNKVEQKIEGSNDSASE